MVKEMNTDPRNYIKILAPLFPDGLLRKVHSRRLILPFYHAVSSHPPPHLKNLYPLPTPDSFRKDLDYFGSHYDILSPGIFTGEGPVHDRPGVIFSFDDGLREVKENVLPLLNERGIKAIFFVNNDFIGNRKLFYRYKVSLICEGLEVEEKRKKLQAFFGKGKARISGDRKTLRLLLNALTWKHTPLIDRMCTEMDINIPEYLEEKKPYLDEAEITAIIDQGHFIGAHSFDHPDFAELDYEEQLRQVLESTLEIQNRFGLGYRFFAFPFTDSGIADDLLRDVHGGETRLLQASFGTAGMKSATDYPHYQRIPMEKYRGDARLIMKTEYIYYGLKSIINRH